MGNKNSRSKYKYNHVKNTSEDCDMEYYDHVVPESRSTQAIRNRKDQPKNIQMTTYNYPPTQYPRLPQDFLQYPQSSQPPHYSQPPQYPPPPQYPQPPYSVADKDSKLQPYVVIAKEPASDQILLSGIQQVIDLIIDFTIDNYRIQYKIEEAQTQGKHQIIINTNELCVCMSRLYTDLIGELYHQDLKSSGFIKNNEYANFLANVIFSTLAPCGKIADVLKKFNVPSFIEQIQELLDPYILIFNEDSSSVSILIN